MFRNTSYQSPISQSKDIVDIRCVIESLNKIALSCDSLHLKLSDTIVSTVAVQFKQLSVSINQERKQLEKICQSLNKSQDTRKSTFQLSRRQKDITPNHNIQLQKKIIDLQDQLAHKNKQIHGFQVNFFPNFDRKDIHRINLTLTEQHLRIDDKASLKLAQINNVQYPNSNALSICDRSGFQFNFIFNTNQQKRIFQRLTWINWKLMTLDKAQKYFIKQNFKSVIVDPISVRQYHDNTLLQKQASQLPYKQSSYLKNQVQYSNLKTSNFIKTMGQQNYVSIGNSSQKGFVNQSPDKKLILSSITQQDNRFRDISIGHRMSQSQYQQVPAKYPTFQQQSKFNNSSVKPFGSSVMFTKPINQSLLNTMSKMTKIDQEEDLTMLSKGLLCTKYAQNGLKPHQKRLHYDQRRNWIVWTDIQDKATYNYIKVNDIKDIQQGRNSPGFAKYDKDQKSDYEKQARSLVVVTNTRVLQLQMKTRQEKQICTRAVRILFRKSLTKKSTYK